MEKTKISLSFNNLRSIHFGKYPRDFTFIVNNKRYEASRFLADFLSPIINNYHFTDESINEFTLTTNENKEDLSDNEDYFSDFLTLSTLDEQEIDESHKARYLNYFLQLGNIDEYTRLQPEHSTNITASNIVELLLLNSTQNELFE